MLNFCASGFTVVNTYPEEFEVHNGFAAGSADGLKISLLVARSSQITLEDLSEPAPGQRVTDLSRSVFRRIEEIDKLRVRQETGAT
jgi:hypothetical protein